MIQLEIKWTTNVIEPSPQVYYCRKGCVGARVTNRDIVNLINAGVIRDAKVIAWVNKWQTEKVAKAKAAAMPAPKREIIERKREDGGLKGYELYKHLESLYGKVKSMPQYSQLNDSIKVGR